MKLRNWLRNWALASAAFGALAIAAPTAEAALVRIDNIRGTWSDAIPGATFSGSGTGFASARWGTDGGFGQSGYDFEAATPPPIDIMVPPSPSPDFFLGLFTHVNQPILPPSITSIRLTVTGEVLIGPDEFNLVSQGDRNFIFDFLHDETTNDADPCAFGGANNQGVNINGCADRVRVTVNSGTESFLIDGVEYTLKIRGFQVDGDLVTEFLTTERENNSAFLVANVVTRASVVPEPATLALFGAGLVGLGLAARRRKAA